MKKWMNRISTLFLLGFSVLILSLSLTLGIGDFRKPGPGFVPLLASLLLLSLSLVILIKEIRGAAAGGSEAAFITRKNLKRPVYMTLALVGYALFFQPLGYLISTFLLMLVMALIYEPKKWGIKIITAAIIVGLSFLLFDLWLRVPLPKGVF